MKNTIVSALIFIAVIMPMTLQATDVSEDFTSQCERQGVKISLLDDEGSCFKYSKDIEKAFDNIFAYVEENNIQHIVVFKIRIAFAR